MVITKQNFTDGQYHWRARAVNSQGNASQWQEFGIAGNMDFEVKLVPLYTQVESDYPSREATRIWSRLNYGIGYYSDCLTKKNPSDPNDPTMYSNIARCGCAITSKVILVDTTASISALITMTLTQPISIIGLQIIMVIQMTAGYIGAKRLNTWALWKME